MAAAASHMVPTGHDSPISSLAPLLLSSLQTISSGQRPLSKAQSEELAESKYKDRFLDYIKSPLSAASKPTSSTDLRYPLSNYFINSSHNTYLTGNQLYSGSSTASYTNVRLTLHILLGYMQMKEARELPVSDTVLRPFYVVVDVSRLMSGMGAHCRLQLIQARMVSKIRSITSNGIRPAPFSRARARKIRMISH